MIYWRRYGADYLVKTIGFSMEMDGAFGRLLDHYYNTESPLPLDQEELFAISRAINESQRDSVMKVLRLKFEKRADGYHNDRADQEIAIASSARENGKKGGNPWVKEHYNEPGYLYAIRGNKPGLIKIGITVDPKRRMTELRGKSGCGDQLALVKVPQMGAAEMGVLEHFSEHANGEWLTVDKAVERQVIAYVNGLDVADTVPASVPKRAPANVGQPKGEHVPDPTPHYAPHAGPKNGQPSTINHQPPAVHPSSAQPGETPSQETPRRRKATRNSGKTEAPASAQPSDTQQEPASDSPPSVRSNGNGQAHAEPATEPAPARFASDDEIPWWHSPNGISRAGVEHGIRLQADEEWREFSARVMAAAGPGPWDLEQPADVLERIEFFRASRHA